MCGGESVKLCDHGVDIFTVSHVTCVMQFLVYEQFLAYEQFRNSCNMCHAVSKHVSSCIDVLNELERGFNKGVKAAMHGLSLRFQGFRYSVGSSHAVVQSITKHPQRLGTYVCPEQLRRFDQIADRCGSGLRESCPGLT